MKRETTDNSDDFRGSKLALIFDGKVLVYKRDDLAHIPFPGSWDFPGGGREGNESPEECVLRELKEEFAISFPAARLSYKRKVLSIDGRSNSYFFVAHGFQADVDAIVFGEEGQCWELMAIDKFLCHPEAVPALVSRLRDYLDVTAG